MADTKYGLGENPPYSLYSVEREGETLWGLVDKDGNRLDAVFHRTEDDRFYCVPHEVVEFDPEEGFSLLAWFDPSHVSELIIKREERLALVPQDYKKIAAQPLDISTEEGMSLLAKLYIQTIRANLRESRFLLGGIISEWLDLYKSSSHPLPNDWETKKLTELLAEFNPEIADWSQNHTRYDVYFYRDYEVEIPAVFTAMEKLMALTTDPHTQIIICRELLTLIKYADYLENE